METLGNLTNFGVADKLEDTFSEMKKTFHKHPIENIPFSETLQAFKPTFENEKKAVDWVKEHARQVDFELTDLQTAIDKVLHNAKHDK